MRLEVSPQVILAILRTFEESLKKSLKAEKAEEREVEWVETWINQLPTGKETGVRKCGITWSESTAEHLE